MVENKNIKVVTEDAVIGNGCNKCTKQFDDGYDDFQYPFTVSFCSEGEYKVVIKGKAAIAEKVK